MKIFTSNKINKFITYCLFLYGIIFSYICVIRLDPSPSVLIQEHGVSDIKNIDLFSEVKISQELTSKYDNLGIVSLRFNTFKRSIDDTLIFRLKEKGAPVWYYTANYKTDQFQNHQLFPFGFPIIQDSKGKTFQIELESKSGSESSHVRIDPLLPVLTSKYQYKFLNSKYFSQSMYKYLLIKFGNIVNIIALQYSIILYFLPFLFFILLHSSSIFWEKNRLYSVAIPLFFVAIRNFIPLPQPAYWKTTILLVWSIYLLKNKLTPKANLIVAMTTIPYIVYQLIEDNLLLAEKGAYWLFIFLVIAVVHNILTQFKSFTQKPLLYWETQVKKIVSLFGFTETHNSSLASSKLFSQVDLDIKPSLKLKNPLTQDQAYLRRSFIPQIFTLIKNKYISMLNRRMEIILFILIMLFGIFLRLWKLDSLPNGLDGDVIASASNSLHIFNKGDFRVFQNNQIIGKPVAYLFWSMPLGSLLIGFFINLFKQIEYGALFSSAFVGIISIPLLYLFAKKITNIPTALLATFFFAVSPIHLVYSRSGFTHITIIVPLVVSAIWLLYKLVATKNTKLFYLCGIIWGLILFNSYPIAYVVAPITIAYLIWTNRWKWLFSREFIFGLLIALISFLLLSCGFAFLNGSSDPLIVLKESYYQWIAVRLNEVRQNTTISKNILSGLQMLFGKITPEYHFGVLRIFNYPLIDHFTGLTFIIGFIILILRRSRVDKLLILWIVFVFSITSVINIPQERYLFVLLPVFYIVSASIIVPFFKTGLISKLPSLRLSTLFLLLVFLFLYAYNTEYKQYFVSYANNNANMTHGLGDGDVAEYLVNNLDPNTSLVVTSMMLPGVELNTNYQFKQTILWSEFISNVAETSVSFSPYDTIPPIYPEHSINTINDGDLNTFWYGRVPTTFYLSTSGSQRISSIIALYSSTGPGRASSGYLIEYWDNHLNQWNFLKKESIETGVCGSSTRDLDLRTNRLKFNFIKTIAGDSLQMVEEIMMFTKSSKNQFISADITDVILVLALNPNFKYYGGYDDRAKIIYRQANTLFGDIDAKLVKTISGNSGEEIYKIYSFKVEDLNL